MREPRSPTVLRIEADAPLPAEAGGKARGLRAIMQVGLSVPRAFVVLPAATDDDVRALADALGAEGPRLLAVRSSAADEDGSRHSFAGIHESRLGVEAGNLLEAVREVAASTGTERAAAYRREMGLRPSTGPCAVVVQDLVAAERAGVAFGVGEENRAVVVEAVEGLGEVLVQGLETPEAWEVERGMDEDAWRVVRRAPRQSPVLTEEQTLRVARGVLALQSAAGTPLDVEWCLEGESLHFVQSRPRTRRLEALHPGQVWTRANFREVLPEVPSALTRSLCFAAMQVGMRRYMAPYLGLVSGDAPQIECLYGRLLANETISLQLMDRLGMPRSLLDVTLGGGDGGPDRFEPMDVRRQLRHPIVMAKAVVRSLTAARRARRFIDECRVMGAEARGLDVHDLSDEDLLHHLGPRVVEMGERFAVLSMLVVVALQNVQYRLASMLRSLPHVGAVITRLVAPGLRTVSTRLTDEMTELALAFRSRQGAAAFLASGEEGLAEDATWRAGLPGDLFERVRAWVGRYAHRGAYESDLASPRYGDDWRLVADLLRPLVAAEEALETPAARRARLAEEGERAWAEVREHVGPLRRAGVRRTVKTLQRMLALREELRSEAVACIYGMRPLFAEAARRLVDRGRLSSPEDLRHLGVEELARALRDETFDANGVVARERGRVAAWGRIEVPNRFRSEDVPAFRDRFTERSSAAEELSGTGISPGLAEGRARCLDTPYDGASLQAGEILVARVTDPGWTPLFARAGGVLVEMGGTLSHAGIVAREFGIPCVSNIPGVLRHVRDGQLLRIDGTRGTVRMLE